MVRAKICGINSPESLAAAADADWIGFNFFPPSPRFVTPSRAAELAGGRARVGLFVDPSDDELTAALSVAALDILQIYADAPRIHEIRRRHGHPVWRAIGVTSRADLPTEPEPVDGYLIEAKAPAGAALPAGNGTAFDWTLLASWTSPLPWLLAGGLHPGNLAAAVAASGATAVDVSSGVERTRGTKDPALIRSFVTEAHALTAP